MLYQEYGDALEAEPFEDKPLSSGGGPFDPRTASTAPRVAYTLVLMRFCV
jgi:hypothetical protein